MDWDFIKVFLTVFRSATYADAAIFLGVDESTIRRRLSQFERMLGTQLFVRKDGRLQLAPEHEHLVKLALTMEAQAAAFRDSTQQVLRSGSVRISMIDLLAIEFADDIARFTADHPEILLDITTEPHIVDLKRDSVDIAIRMARPRRGDEKLKKLGTVGFGIYGEQDYLASAKAAQGHYKMIELGIHFPYADHQFDIIETQWLNELGRAGTVAIQVDCYPAILRLCEAGAGLAILPHFVARQSRKIALYESDALNLNVEIWCLIRPEIAALPKIRKVVDFLEEVTQARIF